MADVPSIITDAAARYGIDPDYALESAQIESGLNPHAQNKTSTAGGLFQFIDST
ncbi:transglycosylase SLT domain-containing protein [Rhizobium sp. S163]|uniref:transglycosylase SLT domain-containing protein n=1 Tax=Rhizobium sp. S163 TaxID=3055039 RepID=UPI0025A931B2|nr:transglycosylase SLT domain-containing protein [Rhizobium sp. S163]MDM9644526.1 transglycosylase SLT domain-containing protein [Rhizobium sp. S163]